MGSGSSGYGIAGTAGSRDAGFSGGTSLHHSLGDNLGLLTSEFPLRNDFFGSKGQGKGIRHIDSDDPITTARDFYMRATRGGIEKPLPNGRGVMTKLSDGTVITMRLISSSDGTPAVDINISKSVDSANVKQQKIHFIRSAHEDN